MTLTLLVVVLPMPFRGVAGAYDDVGTWTMGMVLRYDSGSIAQRPERGFGHKNQSLMALANRLLRDIPADGEAHDGWKVNVASLSFATVNKIILASALFLGTLYVALMPWRAPRTGPVAAIEGALLLLLILAFSPLSFNYFYVWLLYPLTVALYLGGEAPPRSTRAAGDARLGGWFAGPARALAGVEPGGGGLWQLALRRRGPVRRARLEARDRPDGRLAPPARPGPNPPRRSPRAASRRRHSRPSRAAQARPPARGDGPVGSALLTTRRL